MPSHTRKDYTRKIRPATPLLIGLALLLGVARAQTATDASELHTIKVEGHRAADPQRAPSSAVHVDGQELERQSVQRLEDLQQLTPDLDVAGSNEFETSVSIRGVGDGGGNEINVGMPSSVGLFLDGVYLSRPGMLAGDLLDIDGATVLPGPQGTLHGFNTTGGAVDIRTRAPSFQREGSIRQSFGQRGYVQTQGTCSGPLSETLAARISFSHTERDG
ncbi:TonB-dependent receptor plug domain-containing protein [Xylophilus sp.]|uniref:TonB-dependent receptor plug domain-containing protein n=1 Tax=Xylophilus sp. TaxID=2653893 RepID=UPI0013BC8D9A|nr:TonB-dependent receptor plug domain-containing protein [Xylophilus sp.]KAF1046762.1 MAG: Pesticin receptor [Xylophilus sp.]